MNKENCALKLVDEIILYYDARSKKHQITILCTICTYNISHNYMFRPILGHFQVVPYSLASVVA